MFVICYFVLFLHWVMVDGEANLRAVVLHGSRAEEL